MNCPTCHYHSHSGTCCQHPESSSDTFWERPVEACHTPFSRYTRICMVCHRLLGVSVETPPGQTGLTHGLCQKHLDESLAQIGRNTPC